MFHQRKHHIPQTTPIPGGPLFRVPDQQSEIQYWHDIADRPEFIHLPPHDFQNVRGNMTMTDEELSILFNQLESDRIERKEQFSDPDRIRQAICAFANDLPNHTQPGVIFIGVKDRGGCANIPITDELLRSLADMRSDGNILPLPGLTIEKRNLNGCEVAVPSNLPKRPRFVIRASPGCELVLGAQLPRLRKSVA